VAFFFIKSNIRASLKIINFIGHGYRKPEYFSQMKNYSQTGKQINNLQKAERFIFLGPANVKQKTLNDDKKRHTN
jgi:hypothetical protein